MNKISPSCSGETEKDNNSITDLLSTFSSGFLVMQKNLKKLWVEFKEDMKKKQKWRINKSVIKEIEIGQINKIGEIIKVIIEKKTMSLM